MRSIETIVVIHPMAIGDVVLGTPVAAELKRRYPSARIIYFTHTSLLPLLRLCHSIDEYLEWQRKTPLFSQLAALHSLRPDLIVDLTSSLRTRMLCLLSGVPSVRYIKQSRSERPVEHVVDRYLNALSGLKQDAPLSKNSAFPTLVPPEDVCQKVHSLWPTQDGSLPLIALVPGVGKLRPNRAWPAGHWRALGQMLTERRIARIAVVGGADDEELCADVEKAIASENCFNFCNRLSLPETAALLSSARLTVSGDTGPCHISVAVGTPVISVMGATFPERSGPYGFKQIGFNVCSDCKCMNAKRCLVEGAVGAGACMNAIEPATVLARLEDVLASLATGALTR